MSGQNICKYNKYGFCKNRNQCPNPHATKNCDKTSCDVTSCRMRHPMPCRLLAAGDCKFGDLCQFDHRKSGGVKDLEDKIDKLMKENENLKKKSDLQDKTIEELKDNLSKMATEVMMLMKAVYDPPTDTVDMDEDDEEEEEEETEEEEESTTDNQDVLDDQQIEHLKNTFNTIKDIKLNMNNRSLDETYKIMKTLFAETLNLGLKRAMPEKNSLWNAVRNQLFLYELKIKPGNKRNFRKLANEMCDKALNESSQFQHLVPFAITLTSSLKI